MQYHVYTNYMKELYQCCQYLNPFSNETHQFGSCSYVDIEVWQCILEITFTFPLYFCVVCKGAKIASGGS
jgi:hypothetical protein